jgi:hypothetical protein
MTEAKLYLLLYVLSFVFLLSCSFGSSSVDRDMKIVKSITVTYDHRLEKIGHPVRSAIHKLQIGRLVVGWVTTSEYLLLYVFVFFFLPLL